MPLIFISHSSKDRAKTSQIIKKLQEHNFENIFLDYDKKDGIKVGEEWEKRLYFEIKRSHALLVLLSPSWINSLWCRIEYSQAKALGKEIIPIIVDRGENSEVDNWVDSHIQQSDLTQDKNALDHVVTRIKEIAIDTQKGFKWDANRSPYPGLVSFEEEDAAIFFGKEEDTKSIIEILNSMRNKNSPKFLNIVSASGMGKSSLLKAGVIPKLKLSYRDKWILLPVLRPTKNPLYTFAKIIAKVINREKEFKDIYNSLKSPNYQNFLDDVITEIELQSMQYHSILLPIDQAEEFYSIATIKEKEQFFEILSYLLSEKDNFFVVWTLRSDFLKEYQLDEETEVIHKNEILFGLTPLSKENVASIIIEPAKIASIVIDDKLIEKIKEDIQTTDALPLLALCLNELYSKYHEEGRFTLTNYQNLTDSKENNPLETIVKKRADEAIENYKKEDLIALKKAFIPHLVRVNSKNEYVKHTALWNNLPLSAYKILEELIKARLLIKSYSDEKVLLEISHEALIRKWSLLKKWLNEEQEFLIGKTQLEISLQEWKNVDKSSKALLHGIRLEKALEWKDKLHDNEELNYINRSLQFESTLRKKRRTFLIGAFGTISSFGIFSAWQWRKVNKAEKASTQKSLLLSQEILHAKHNIGLFFAEKAIESLEEKRFGKAHLYTYYALSYLVYKLNKSDILSKLIGILECHPYIKCSFIGREHKAGVYKVLISPDSQTFFSSSDDKTIKMWNMRSGKVIKTFRGHSNSVSDIQFLSNNILISSSRDTNIKFWDIKTGKNIRTLKGHTKRIYSFVLTSDRKILISGSWDKTIIIWDIATSKIKKTLIGHTDRVEDIKISKNNKILYSASRDKTIGVWDLKKEKLIHFIKGHKDGVNNLLLLSKNILVSTSHDKTIKFWNIEKNIEIKDIEYHKSEIYGISKYYDKNIIISSFRDSSIKFININLDKEIYVLDSHLQGVENTTISLNKTILASASWDETLRLWDLSTIKNPMLLKGNSEKIYNLRLSSSGRFFSSTGRDKKIYVRDIVEGKVISMMEGHTETVCDAHIFSKEEKLVSVSYDKTIKLWNIKKSKCIKTLHGHESRVYSLSISSDEKILASSSEDSTIILWNMDNYKIKSILKGHSENVYNIDISKNGKFLVSGSYDKTVKLWDIDRGKCIKTLMGHTERVYFVKFHPNSQTLFSTGRDKTIRQWDVETGETIKIFKGHTHRIYTLAISPDGNTLVSGSRDNTIRFWNIESGLETKCLKGHKQRIYSIDITPDGKTLISASWDETIRFWDMKTGECTKVLKEYRDVDIVSHEDKIIKLADNSLLDIPRIKSEIKNLEKQFQVTLNGIKLQPKLQPYSKPEWSKTHPLYQNR